MDRKPKWPFVPLGVAMLIVSDTRTPETDSSGDFIEQRLKGAGHRIVARLILKDKNEALRAPINALPVWLDGARLSR